MLVTHNILRSAEGEEDLIRYFTNLHINPLLQFCGKNKSINAISILIE